MKALILRDIRAYQFFYMLLMIIMILYAYLNIRFGSTDGIIGFLLIMIPSFAGALLFIGDDGLIPLFASLPVNRRQLVISKYLSSFLIATLLILFSYSILGILGINYSDAKDDLGLLLTVKGILFSVIPVTLVICTCYPFLFRYGLKMGVRILMGGFAFVYGIGMMALERLVQANLRVPRRGVFIAGMTLFRHLESLTNPLVLYAMIILGLIILLITSLTLSIRWFSLKDIP